MEKIINYLSENWIWIAPLLLEVGARVIKTEKNYSVFDGIVKLIGIIIPNRAKYATTVTDHNKMSIGKPIEQASKIISKHVIKIILLLFLSVPAFAQVDYTGKQFNSINSDSITVRTRTQGLEVIHGAGNVGTLYYNTITRKWRKYVNTTSIVGGGQWSDLGSGGGGGGGVTSVTGTLNRITSTGGATPQIDISPNYVGQSTITTLGNVSTGTWNGTTISTQRGGTGLSSIGTALQVLRVNAGATGLEYATISGGGPSFGTIGQVPYTNAGGTDFDYTDRFVYNPTLQSFENINGLTTSRLRMFSNGTTTNASIISDYNSGTVGSSVVASSTSTTGSVAVSSTGSLGTTQLSMFSSTANAVLQFSSQYTNFPGVTYDIDYSANYTVRSLPDVNYVNTSGPNAITSSTVSTGSGTITIDLENKKQKIVVGSSSFSTSKNIALTNTTNSLVFNFTFTITDLAATLVMPSNFKMSDTRWDSALDTWTPLITGQYEMGASFDGSSWLVKIAGPFN